MKIENLKIHNIASIEDAEIDFTVSPLKESDVYLITGETGSGKTTILDSICLALYDTTPRISKGKHRVVMNNKDNLALDDPRRMMRRDTGWAYVKLSFEGIDGKKYMAEWSVQRGKTRKPTNDLDNETWSLENLTDGKTYTGIGKKNEDVRLAIQSAVGLDFSQFCRTTMLAQGEFTEFLKSDEDKKIDILEKIADFSEYAKIGKRVHEIAVSRKRTVDDARKDALDNGLDEQQLQELNDCIDGLNREISNLGNTITTAEKKRDWVEQSQNLEKERTKAESRLSVAMIDKNSEDCQKKERTAREWQSTIQIRAALDACNAAKKQLGEINKNIEGIQKDYAAVLGGIEFNRQQLDQKRHDEAELKQWLDEHTAKAEIYANSQTIVAQLEQVAKMSASIATENQKVSVNTKLVKEKLKPESEKAGQALQEAEIKLKELDVIVDGLQKELEKMHLDDLHAEKVRLDAIPGKVETAKTRIAEWVATIKTFQNRKSDHSEQFKELASKRIELSSKEHSVSVALAEAKALEAVLKKQMVAMEDWACVVRKDLHIGDKCPVCGQMINSVLPEESALQNVINLAQQDYVVAEGKYKELKKAYDTLDAQITVLQKSYDKEKILIGQDVSVPNAAKLARKACEELGIVIEENVVDIVPPGLEDSLDEILKSSNESLNSLTAKLKVAEDKKTEFTGKLNNQKSLKKNIDDILKPDFENKQESLTTTEAAIQLSNNLIKGYKQQTDDAIKVLNQYLSRESWEENPNKSAECLKLDAKKYSENQGKHQKLAADIEKLGMLLDNVTDVQGQATASLPLLEDVATGVVCDNTDLLGKITGVATKAASASQSKKSAEQALNDSRQTINSFLGSNAGFSEDRLTELNSYTSGQIDVMNVDLKKVNDEVQSAEGALNNVKGRIIDHNAQKPELSEEDTLDKLQLDVARLEQSKGELNQEYGAKVQELKNDTQKKLQQADKQIVLQSATEEYNRWHRLDSLIGSADGKTFVKIAQCYLMDGLLDSANQYLAKLAPRYTLKSVPGMLYMSVEDSYQGFATRGTDSLSGGEGFLVSLALALALADVGQSLSVDTLFIDEGFGTLSGAPLTNAINTLRTLHGDGGRHVGIISHLPQVKESISTQIQVIQQGASSNSTIAIVGH